MMIQNYDQFGVVLITDKPSIYLKRAMIKFGEEFTKQYQEVLKSIELVESKVFQKADEIVIQAFGLA